MSAEYVAVTWNRQKRRYDLVAAASLLLLLGLYLTGTLLSHPNATPETALIRGLGLTAILLLHVILCIGPLCRLSPAFLPLLYNRRHLGVMMAVVALGHAGFAVFQFHALGDLNPLVSLLSGNRHLAGAEGFPFELLGLAGLVIIVLMAATSHDFWLSVLTPPVWKGLHMMVYLAYALLIGHVALGSMQAETGSALPVLLGLGAVVVVGLHLAAAVQERRRDRPAAGDEWVPVCRVDVIPEKRARVAMVGGERVAVFRYDGLLSCVSNVCRHQNGPLGEGKIVDGCITCPWHGYQYRPDTGTSPPPFTDKVPTYDLRVSDGMVLVKRTPHAPGTRVEPVPVSGTAPVTAAPFYIGYAPAAEPKLARHTRVTVGTLGLLGCLVMLTAALAQRPFAAATFAYGHPETVAGTILPGPYPTLQSEEGGRVRRYLLAAGGKHGADALTASYRGQRVRVLGTRIARGNGVMLEVASLIPDSGEGAPAGQPAQTDLGNFTLTGEIVDAKCWLGVMNPGEGQTHLSCAVRCLSGGLPPLLAVRDLKGAEVHLVLTDSAGGPMSRQVLPTVGRPVRITGRVVREGEMLFLHANPGAIELLR